MTSLDVIIPCAGSGRYFAETLRSVVAQPKQELRILVCDNACAHNEYQKIALAVQDPRVAYIRYEKRLPFIENWQRCLEQIQSELFCFIHDDDVWAVNFLEECMACFTSAEVVFVLAEHRSFNDRTTYSQAIDAESRALWTALASMPWPALRTLLYCCPLSHMSSTVFRRRSLGMQFARRYNPDQCFVRDYAVIGEGRVTANTHAKIRLHDTSVTSSFPEGRASRDTIALIRENLLVLARNGLAVADIIDTHLECVGSGGLFRILQALHSWPLEPMLLAIGKELLSKRRVVRVASSYSVLGYILARMPRLGWMFAGLCMDIIYFRRVRRGDV